MALKNTLLRLSYRHSLRGLIPRNGATSSPRLRRIINTPAAREMSMFTGNHAGLTRRSFSPLVVPVRQQVRGLFIQTEETPNPASLKFLPGHEVLPAEFGASMDFRKSDSFSNSPLAKVLLRINGVQGVFLGADFITVSKSEAVSWAQLKPEIFSALMDFFAEGKVAVTAAQENAEHEASEDDDEVVELIKELLEERIRPMVQEDGGDILYKGFDHDTGVVTVKLAGSCVGCPSSTITLKSGVENMLMHYIPEVKRVDEVIEDEDVNARKLSWQPSI